MDLLRVLTTLVPGKHISFKEGCEETLSNVIIWNDQTKTYDEEYPLPSQEECQEYWDATLKNSIFMTNIRRKRDRLLKESDWIVSTPDAPFTQEKIEEWKVYRQALRDLPANTTDPENPVWPEAPTP